MKNKQFNSSWPHLNSYRELSQIIDGNKTNKEHEPQRKKVVISSVSLTDGISGVRMSNDEPESNFGVNFSGVRMANDEPEFGGNFDDVDSLSGANGNYGASGSNEATYNISIIGSDSGSEVFVESLTVADCNSMMATGTVPDNSDPIPSGSNKDVDVDVHKNSRKKKFTCDQEGTIIDFFSENRSLWDPKNKDYFKAARSTKLDIISNILEKQFTSKYYFQIYY